jgi:hypothetical protein
VGRRGWVRQRTERAGPSSYASAPGRCHPAAAQEKNVSLSTILLIVLVLVLVGALPAWPHSASWGYGPSGGLGLLVIVLLVLLLTGRL